VVVASLAFVGVANAGVQVISPDGTGNLNCPATPPTTLSTLSTALNNATAASNTIVLTPGWYCPTDPTGTTTITISHNLNIISDHSFQATGGLPKMIIDGFTAQPNQGALFTIAPGVTVRFDGINFAQAGTSGGPVVQNNGNLTLYGDTFEGEGGESLINAAGATATAVDTTADQNPLDSFDNFGTMTLINDSFLNNAGAGVDNETGATTDAFNVLLAGNSTTVGSCNVTSGAGTGFSNAPAPGTLDDDGTCGAQFSDQTGVDAFIGPNAAVAGTGQTNTNGGPTTSIALAPNSFTTLQGVSADCPTTDQRFFVNPVVSGTRECDIGAVTGSLTSPGGPPAANSATQETAGPSCKVTGGTTGVSQNVTLLDTLSGIGPEAGLQTDNPSNTIATAYPPPAAVPVAGNAVTNLQDNNGSVSFTSPTSPTTSGVVLTAGGKTTAGVNNAMWSFTGMNWAGVATNCF